MHWIPAIFQLIRNILFSDIINQERYVTEIQVNEVLILGNKE